MTQPTKGLWVSIAFGVTLAGTFLTWSPPESSRPLAAGFGQNSQPAPMKVPPPPLAEDSVGRPGVLVGVIPGHSNAGSGLVEHPITQARRVVLDPVTGELLQEPSPSGRGTLVAGPESIPQPEASTSTQGLRELPGTTRAGGVKVDLGGRFFHFTTVTLDAQGQTRDQCQQNLDTQSPASHPSPASSSP